MSGPTRFLSPVQSLLQLTRVLVLAVTTTLALVIAAPSALAAAPTRPFDHSLASGFAAPDPQALTVDQASGDVYALDSTNGTVHRFHRDGTPHDFTAGPDAGTNTLGATSPFAFSLSQVAVDASGGPSDGNIYVDDGSVHVFSHAGAPLGTLTGSGTPAGAFSFTHGLAVDQSNGDLYVADENDFTHGIVWRYSPSSATVSESDYSGAITAAGGVGNVAVGAGRLYTANVFSFGEVRSYALSDFTFPGPSPSPASTLIAPNASAIDADPATGDVYVDLNDHVEVYDSSGAHLYDFATGRYGTSLGVAVTSASGPAYVSDGDTGKIDVYGSSIPPATSRLFDHSFASGFAAPDPQALTVDQASGDVYALDSTNGTVHRFHRDGTPHDFTAGPDAGTNTLGATSPFAFSLSQVAVDASGGPSDGNIYVDDGSVHVFSHAGAPLGTLTGSGTPAGAFSFTHGLAVDQSNGDLYVADENDFTHGIVWRYSPSSATVSESDYSGAITAAGGVGNVAVGAGRLYTANVFSFGEVRSYALSDFTDPGPNPSPASTLIAPNASAIEADPATGDVYVDLNDHVEVFDAAGNSLYSFATGLGTSLGLAVTSASGPLYVSDGDTGKIDVFLPGPVNPPVATTNAASAINHTTATLNGHLDPGDETVTDCHFEWGTSTSYGHTAPCTPAAPFTHPADVSADITGLAPGTTYHVRLDITGDTTGLVTGADQTFDSTAFPVTTDPATKIHHTDVVLGGHFDPQGAPDLAVTACSFDWGTTTAYSGGSVPCAEGQNFSASASVSAVINDLTPGVTYHFRLHLDTAGAGENFGQDQTVTPPLFPTISPQIAAFGPDGTSATSFSANNPFTLAFDQVNGKLFAADDGPPGIYGFDATAAPALTPLVGFAPLATVPQGINELAVDNTALSSGGNIYLASGATGLVYGFDAGGVSLGGNFPIDTANSPGSPDGSPKQVCGDAVDSTGDLWVSNAATGRLLRYTSAGSFLSSVNVSAQFPPPVPFGLCSMAFDSNDDLYVAAYRGEIWRFTHSSGYTAATQIENASADNRGIAVDPTTHDLLVVHNADVDLYDANGVLQATIATGIPGAAFGGLAVNATTHDVYVPDRNVQKIRVFHPETQRPPTITPGDPTAVTGVSATLNAKVDPETFSVTDCHFDYNGVETDPGNPHASPPVPPTFVYSSSAPCTPDPGSGSGDVAVHGDLTGLNAGSTYHFRIVASNAQPGGTATGPDQAFTTAGPAIADTRATDVSDSAVTLRASVNPRGHSTTYQFEYGTDTGYGHTAPVAPAAIGAGSSAFPVAERVTGLDPSTTYHFRVVAVSSDGTDRGPDATFTTFAGLPDFSGDGCDNQAFRSGPGTVLPDCRAYEQASPVDKNGNEIIGNVSSNQAAADGHAAVFVSLGDLNSTGSHFHAQRYVAHRGPGGWSYDAATPLAQSVNGDEAAIELGRDDNLDISLSRVRAANGGGTLFLTDLTSFQRQTLLSLPSFSALRPDPQFAAHDTAHFTFESTRALLPGVADLQPNLYDYDHGDLTLAGRVPVFPATRCDDSGGGPSDDCVVPPAGSFAGSYDTLSNGLDNSGTYKQNTLSDDGSRVFFTESGTGRLYMRSGGTVTTQINAPQGATDPGGHKPAAFLAATPDGHTVYFSSCEKLTPDSTAVSAAADACTGTSGPPSFTPVPAASDLYAYDTASGHLTDLTAVPGAGPMGADVQGLLGASPDGNYLYFTANGDLDGAGPATTGDCDTSASSGELTGTCSLYLAHDGELSFVARLGPGRDSDNWRPSPPGLTRERRTSRVADDGTLLFSSVRPLTSFDNNGPRCAVRGHGVLTPGPCNEFYRFDPHGNGGSGQLDCVSCNPTGAPALGNAEFVMSSGETNQDTAEYGNAVLTHNLSSDGTRVFFQTADKLVAGDVNGDGGCEQRYSSTVGGVVFGPLRCMDVYEWEADGSGSCNSGAPEFVASEGGCLYLLSSGTSDEPSFLDDASVSGDDAFIFTASQLVPQDQDHLADLYDVRVGGGLSLQHQVAPPPCTGDSCQGTPSGVPAVSTAASVTFGGPGNAMPGAAATAKVKLLSRVVHGSTFVLKVSVPGRGRVTISGAGVGTVGKSVSKAGTYALRVTLTSKEKRLLRPKGKLKLKLKVRVSYAPAGGGASSSLTFSITDKDR